MVGGDKAIHEVDPDSLPDPASDQELLALSEGDWTQEELYCSPEGQVLLMKGEKAVPESFLDLQTARMMVLAAYMKARNDGAPEKVLQGFRDYLLTVQDLIRDAQMQAAQMQAPPAPMGGPGVPMGGPGGPIPPGLPTGVHM